jgi:hypothetical protein
MIHIITLQIIENYCHFLLTDAHRGQWNNKTSIKHEKGDPPRFLWQHQVPPPPPKEFGQNPKDTPMDFQLLCIFVIFEWYFLF